MVKITAYDKKRLGGVFYFLSGAAILMGIITAEALYPVTYTTRNNEISDLGATRPPNSIILQPSAAIFDWLMIITGVLLIAAAIYTFISFRKILFFIPALLLGIGVLGVGLFPGNHSISHPIFALLAFLFGGIACIASFKLTSGPFRYLSILIGLITLFFLFLSKSFFNTLGDGGTERWIAYPVIIWLMGFGGYLMGHTDQNK